MAVYQRKDSLYLKAKKEGYRSRAAFKLLEVDRKYKILPTNGVVLDLGSFPGGWLQVAYQKISANGMVIGVDLRPIEPFTNNEHSENCHFICGDIFSSEVMEEICAKSNGGIDLLLSDMSPKLTGISFRDQCNSAELARRAFELGCKLLRCGGSALVKIFPGPEANEVFKNMKCLFKSCKRMNLQSSRKSSNEQYLLGLCFIGSNHRIKNEEKKGEG